MFLCKLPMKNGIPCLEYDMAAAAQFLLPEVPNVVPAYLSGYFKNLRALADKSEALRPKKFPTGNRVYILDCRFNLLFAGIDQAPSWSVEMYDYAHQHRSQTRYHYGNGVSFESDSATMDAFVRQFGFLPNDYFAQNTIFFLRDSHPVTEQLTTFQTMVLMKHYQEQNLVDWESLAARLPSDD